MQSKAILVKRLSLSIRNLFLENLSHRKCIASQTNKRMSTID